MSHIQIIFKDSSQNSKRLEIKTVKKIRTIEKEGELPVILLTLDISEYQSICELKFCEVIRDNKLFFDGIVTNLIIQGSLIEITARTKDTITNFQSTETEKEVQGMIDNFREENPEIFTKTSVEECSKTGIRTTSSLKAPSETPFPIDSYIICDSLKIEESKEMPISEVNLSIKAAWISKKEGAVNLSTKIENRFKMARINTLTPTKLENSWPEFGDRIRSNGTAATKYMISSSRLRETELQLFPAISIDEKIPPLKLSKHIYENRLQIAWDFEQYMNETIHINLCTATTSKGTAKSIRINLGNVQGYIDDPYQTSFFRNRNGRAILNEIIKSIADYVTLSWRNIEVSFDMIGTNSNANLSCKDWVQIQGRNYKIIQIEREIDSDKEIIRAKARAFGIDISRTETNPPVLDLVEERPVDLSVDDVIEDIAVQNEADVQYEKLLKFISTSKKDNSINQRNYKSLINSFLNENQTKIQIITKPIKTEHCEKKIIGPINLTWNI